VCVCVCGVCVHVHLCGCVFVLVCDETRIEIKIPENEHHSVSKGVVVDKFVVHEPIRVLFCIFTYA